MNHNWWKTREAISDSYSLKYACALERLIRLHMCIICTYSVYAKIVRVKKEGDNYVSVVISFVFFCMM